MRVLICGPGSFGRRDYLKSQERGIICFHGPFE
jgi:hypothetical protein